MKNNKLNYFIGIDVSRNKLDVAVMKRDVLVFHKVIKNQVADIESFVQELALLSRFTLPNAVFCLEQSGFYGNHLLECLAGFNANIVADNPLQIKRSLGIVRTKTDKTDAIGIATYAFKNRDNLRWWRPKRLIIDRLANLSTLRARLINLRGIINTPLQEQRSFVNRPLHEEGLDICKSSRQVIADDVRAIDKLISTVVNSDERIKWLAKIITSVPGVGLTTAVQVIITTNEFLHINDAKKFACYAGVAPFPKESGNTIRPYRTSAIANKRMKALLHMCAVSAYCFNPEFKAYYKRKTEAEGKPKMAVMNTLRNKLILRIFSCVKQDRLYEANYICDEAVTAIVDVALVD